MRFFVLLSWFLGVLRVPIFPQPWGGVGTFQSEIIEVWEKENVEARLAFRQLFTATLEELDRFRERVVLQRTGGSRVKVSTERSNGAVYILFRNESAGDFPVYSAGSWILKRDGKTGALIQVKIFYRTEPRCYLRLFPSGGKTLMDVYLFDSLLYKSVPIGTNLSLLLTEPFQQILDRTRSTVDWSILLRTMDSSFYSSVLTMVQKIRKELPKLPDAEDGAMDRSGKLVFIANLRAQERLPGFNCSGFAKWVADGLYRPRTGQYLDIQLLKEKHFFRRGSRITNRFEEERDPFFGLDWTRNIARALAGGGDPEKQDVRYVPFWKYREDVGYPIQDIEGILFSLAILEPGNFYLGSINREYGTNPVLRQHVHVVVLFPYFTSNGEFHVAVFERNVETDLSFLRRKFDGTFIHLVRIKADSSFEPPRIEYMIE
ncbi:MAG: hypothetical protein N2442_11235 [Spirochaetes bacterium]|nr:hypothetical protein [Spirochaetota bacterium]